MFNLLQLSGSRGSKKGHQSRLHSHAATKYHLINMEKWQSHKDTKKTSSVIAQISSLHKLLIECNHM